MQVHAHAQLLRPVADPGIEELAARNVIAWANRMLEAKDPYTRGHCARVAEYSERLARAAGVQGRALFWLRIGAFLHDIGKIAVPVQVLRKPDRLNAQEWELIRRHTVLGTTIIERLQLPYDVRPIVRGHHERWDGRGYPDGLRGERIPLAARIVAVADVYDAVTSARCYSSPTPDAEARSVLDVHAGRSLDPRLVELFVDEVLAGARRAA